MGAGVAPVPRRPRCYAWPGHHRKLPRPLSGRLKRKCLWHGEPRGGRAHSAPGHLPAAQPRRGAQGIHEVAYKGALARPLLCPESALPGLSADKLRAFHARNFTAPRIVLAAAGVQHATLKSLADELVGGLPSAPPSPTPASTYVGGDFRCAARCGAGRRSMAPLWAQALRGPTAVACA